MKEKRFKAQRCNRCNHKWLSKGEEEPRVCPRCKSVYWNVPRKLHYDWHAKHKKLVKV
jgi:phage FluMu protein Com